MSRYARPWEVADSEELRLLRELERSLDGVTAAHGGVTMETIRALDRLRKSRR